MKPESAWPAMLAAALSFGVPPACFWRLSLKEWRALTAPRADAPLSRAGFEALARRFPDVRT